MRFCGNCGNPLDASCSHCGFNNPAGFKFCGQCGQKIGAAVEPPAVTSPPTPSAVPQSSAAGERRHLTVMFCDLVGSTALSHRLDPEDLRSVVAEYQDVCDKIVARYEGHVAQYLGDGIMVYFGYPVAHENAAHRAASSGLGILEALAQLNERLEDRHRVKIAVRIGIHTGHVVIGEMGGSEQAQRLALGATPNVAARLEGLAEANTVLISSDTYKLVQSNFLCEPKGFQTLKGLDGKMEVFRVVKENTARTRFDLAQAQEQNPLVGRTKESEKLLAAWEEAKAGKSAIVLLSGEAGVGKSRILQSLIEHVAAEPDTWLTLHTCSPFHRSTTYHPIAQSLTAVALQFKAEETAQEKILRLEGFLLQYGLNLQELVPLLASMLAIPIDDTGYAPTPFSQEQQRQKLISAFITIYRKRSQQQHLLLVFEDLQWVDEATLEVITQMIKQEPSLNILTVLTYRPDFAPPWRMQPHMLPIAVSHLDRIAMEQIIHNITKGKRLPAEVLHQIIEKTDGVPLFVEELTKMVLGSSMLRELEHSYELTGPVAKLTIPSTLHDSLVARLDRMSHTKEIAQLAATIGREFSYQLIRSTSTMDEMALSLCLNQLVEAELLLQQGFPPQSSYRFRHALIQDAAYESLLKSQQQQFHKRIAESMRTHMPEVESEKPAVLAHHFARSGEKMEAVKYYIKASEKARQLKTFDQVLIHSQKARALMDDLEPSDALISLRLRVATLEAPVYLFTEGFTSQNAHQAYQLQYELAEQIDDLRATFRGLRGIATYALFTGKVRHALSKAEEALALARSHDDQELVMEGLRLVGQTSIYCGELRQSLQSFDESLKTLEAADREAMSGMTGFDFAVFCLCQSSHVTWYLGYPDQALTRAKQAVDRANEIKHPFSQAMSLFLYSLVLSNCGRHTQSLEVANACIEVAKAYGLSMFENEAMTFAGAGLVETGQVDEGMEMISAMLRRRTAHQMLAGYIMQGSVQAGLYVRLGRLEEGLDLVRQLFKINERSHDQLALSEIHRFRAELHFARDGAKELPAILADLDQSLQIARGQEAKSYELRAAFSKARILQALGRPREATDVLKEVYDWFTEGFDTADLLAAKHLLKELSRDFARSESEIDIIN